MTVAAELLTLLAERGWRLGVAESLTGGAVSAELVTVPGASAVLNGAVVAYATPVKQTLLGVDAKLLEQHGPVHPEVAEQMADGVRRAVAVDARATEVGVSTTGIAGPDSPDGQPVGTVHVGVVTPVVRLVRSFVFAGDRSQIRTQARDAVLAAALEAVRE
ncbi:nicotinamide-nucleotide amidohydrolase family protein [Microbacterium esteraromaticum]|uniref:CinA family protein n=1 Tax=Microbacterium esteraromaticum TaxID=57043 RepID=UPI002367AEFC|nr:nicotinamide-nucleotide amidohydrolase family protein [Microbacterium esteraromaticum]WDH80000.1 nicotinamide-nucleotide amidohydrolase family protein [Microbacterium esteraromaticum]